jgi:hypothetical protein
MEDFFIFIQSYLDLEGLLLRMGENPVQAMWFFVVHGGWIVFLWFFGWVAREMFLNWRQHLYAHHRQWILLAIDVPKATEQTVKAVENMFAHMAGIHNPPHFLEKWWDGYTQDTITCEIVSIEGHIQFLIRTVRKMRDLVEASVYAQYPDAEITEVADYTLNVPMQYPDEHYDLFGMEMYPVPGRSDVYPIKTYMDFEHQLTGEFKDPLAVLLEAFARLGPGEQAWYQISKILCIKRRRRLKKLQDKKKCTIPVFCFKLLSFRLRCCVG